MARWIYLMFPTCREGSHACLAWLSSVYMSLMARWIYLMFSTCRDGRQSHLSTKREFTDQKMALVLPVHTGYETGKQTTYWGLGILLAESRRSIKKSWKPGKSIGNLARNRKMPFWCHRKLNKKSADSRKKHIFLRKVGNRPPIPGPPYWIKSMWRAIFSWHDGMENYFMLYNLHH